MVERLSMAAAGTDPPWPRLRKGTAPGSWAARSTPATSCPPLATPTCLPRGGGGMLVDGFVPLILAGTVTRISGRRVPKRFERAHL